MRYRRRRFLGLVMTMIVSRRWLRSLSVMMMLWTALMPVANLAHDAVVVAQHERRGGKRRHLAGQPDRRYEPDVRADTHHWTAYKQLSSRSRATASTRP